jgi:Resolvase, N terminal domain
MQKPGDVMTSNRDLLGYGGFPPDPGWPGGGPRCSSGSPSFKPGRIDIVVVYKVDRLTRSLADFGKIVEILDFKGASFVSVTKQFNTTTSMGRLTLNVLLSFAQFERESFAANHRKTLAARLRQVRLLDRLTNATFGKPANHNAHPRFLPRRRDALNRLDDDCLADHAMSPPTRRSIIKNRFDR